MKTLSERISWLMATYQLSQSELARVAKVKQPSVNAWISGKTKTLNTEAAFAICAKYPVMLTWLLNGEGEPIVSGKKVIEADVDRGEIDDSDLSEEFVIIKASNVRCSAGNGYAPNYYDSETKQGRVYKRSWLQKNHLNPKNLMIFPVHGDSMEPRLFDDDSITVDTSQKDVINGRVYAFVFNGEYRVKRLRKLIDGGLLVISDNPSWGDEKIEAQYTENVFIIGRVVDKSGSGGL